MLGYCTIFVLSGGGGSVSGSSDVSRLGGGTFITIQWGQWVLLIGLIILGIELVAGADRRKNPPRAAPSATQPVIRN